MRGWLVLVVVAAITAGCVTRVPLATDYAGPELWPLGIGGAAPLEPEAESLVATAEEQRDRLGFTVRDLSLPAQDDSHEPIAFEYYDVDGSERTPVVVLLPIFNGQLFITRFFARYFANQGWAAIIAVRGRDALDGLNAPEEAIRENLSDYRRVLDWVEQQPELDAERIGLFGISFGAMDAVMLTALDHRIDALVVAMAGGDLPYVMMNTHYRPVARTVQDLLAEPGMSRDVLRSSLDERFVTDPLELAPYVDAERVLMIMTRTDAIIPFEAQEALRASMGTPETLYLPTGHRTSVVFFPKVRASAYEFFARRFALAEATLSATGLHQARASKPAT